MTSHPTPPPAAIHAVSAGARPRGSVAALPSVTRTQRFIVPAEPARVFPLLCPVREFDWIPTWHAEILHSVSGVAEEDCVFRTEAHDGAAMTWVVSRYEPPTRIEFTCFVPGHYVFRLKISLEPVAGGTQLTWTRHWLATAPADAAFSAATAVEDFDTKMAALEGLLVHYLRTGEMLRP